MCRRWSAITGKQMPHCPNQTWHTRERSVCFQTKFTGNSLAALELFKNIWKRSCSQANKLSGNHTTRVGFSAENMNLLWLMKYNWPECFLQAEGSSVSIWTKLWILLMHRYPRRELDGYSISVISKKWQDSTITLQKCPSSEYLTPVLHAVKPR